MGQWVGYDFLDVYFSNFVQFFLKTNSYLSQVGSKSIVEILHGILLVADSAADWHRHVSNGCCHGNRGNCAGDARPKSPCASVHAWRTATSIGQGDAWATSTESREAHPTGGAEAAWSDSVGATVANASADFHRHDENGLSYPDVTLLFPRSAHSLTRWVSL